MRPELDFNDPDTAEQRFERVGRLGSSPEEHLYLHETLDEAVAELQRHGHFISWLPFLWLALVTVAVVFLLLRP